MISRAVAVILAAIGAAGAGAGDAAAATLLDRSGNGNGQHWPSQDFAAPDDAYDSEIVDHFSVPYDRRWHLTSVRAIGTGGTPTTARVTVYDASASSGPGAIRFTREASAAPPDYEISLAGSPPLSSSPFYWISIQAVGGGQANAWRWSQRADSDGSQPLYRNPGNGYGTGCGFFSQISQCWGSSGDMQYVLFGESVDETPPPASNDFTLRRPDRDKKRGTAKLPVRVESSGTVSLTGPKLRPASASAAGGETARLKVAARGAAKRKLERRGKLKVSGTITFLPQGGASASRPFQVKLIRDG